MFRILALAILLLALSPADAQQSSQRAAAMLLRGADAWTFAREQQELSKDEKEILQFHRLRYNGVIVVPFSVESLSEEFVSIDMPGRGAQVLRRVPDSVGGTKRWKSEGEHGSVRASLSVHRIEGQRIWGTFVVGNVLFGFQPVRDGFIIIFEEPEGDVTVPIRDILEREPSSKKSESTADIVNPLVSAAQVDVLFVFTPSALTFFGGDPNGVIADRIFELNFVFVGDISATARSVGWIGTTKEPSTAWDMVYLLSNAPEVKLARMTKKADLVVGIGGFTDVRGAAVPGVDWRFPNAAVGRGSFGDDTTFTFTHEVGHLLGADHDPEFLSFEGKQPMFPAGRGMIVYSCPYNDGCHATVMSVPDLSRVPGGACPRIWYFSNPSRTFDAVALGTPTQNNVGVIRTTVGAVAAYSDEMIRSSAVQVATVVALLN